MSGRGHTNTQQAQRAHDRRDKDQQIFADQIKVFSLASMRAPALAAAGGIAMALGFYSANYSRISDADQILGAILFLVILGGWFHGCCPSNSLFKLTILFRRGN
jgi:hypothetical protein